MIFEVVYNVLLTLCLLALISVTSFMIVNFFIKDCISKMLGNCPKCYSDTAKMKRVSGMFCVRCESCGARTEYFTESEKAKFAWNNKMVQEWEGIPDE